MRPQVLGGDVVRRFLNMAIVGLLLFTAWSFGRAAALLSGPNQANCTSNSGICLTGGTTGLDCIANTCGAGYQSCTEAWNDWTVGGVTITTAYCRCPDGPTITTPAAYGCGPRTQWPNGPAPQIRGCNSDFKCTPETSKCLRNANPGSNGCYGCSCRLPSPE